MKDVKIKICGIKRAEDVAIINRYHPDYIGFIINFPKSHRSKTPQEVEILSEKVDSSIQKVGVFVDSPMEIPVDLAAKGAIDVIQLHGSEDETYIQALQQATGKPVIKAFTIHGKEDMDRALESSADIILLDQGQGSGQTFDWGWIPKDMTRPYFLAGGLTPENVPQAYEAIKPWGMDISSGVETDRLKDEAKICSIMEWREE